MNATTKQSQIAWARYKLEKHGSVSRNEALQHYITRLAAIVHILRAEGMNIKGRYVLNAGGQNYVYSLEK